MATNNTAKQNQKCIEEHRQNTNNNETDSNHSSDTFEEIDLNNSNDTFTIDSDELDVSCTLNLTNQSMNSSASNYLSPHVTTKRGKGNRSVENKNRNSIYRLEMNQSIEEPIIVRQAKEAVQYFRMNIKNEIDKLVAMTTKWQTYKRENFEQVTFDHSNLISDAIKHCKQLVSDDCAQFIRGLERTEQNSHEFYMTEQLALEERWLNLMEKFENVEQQFDYLSKNGTGQVVEQPKVSTGSPAVKNIVGTGSARKSRIPVMVSRKSNISM